MRIGRAARAPVRCWPVLARWALRSAEPKYRRGPLTPGSWRMGRSARPLALDAARLRAWALAFPVRPRHSLIGSAGFWSRLNSNWLRRLGLWRFRAREVGPTRIGLGGSDARCWLGLGRLGRFWSRLDARWLSGLGLAGFGLRSGQRFGLTAWLRLGRLGAWRWPGRVLFGIVAHVETFKTPRRLRPPKRSPPLAS